MVYTNLSDKPRMYKMRLLRVSDVLLMFVELRYLYVYRNTLVEFAAYFSTRSVRGLSYTLLTAIKKLRLLI